MQKKKQIHKSKLQLLMEARFNKEEKARKKFIDEKFVPLMNEVTENLEDVGRVTETLKIAINQGFTNLSKKIVIKELGLIEQLNRKDKHLTVKYTKILNMLKDQTIDDALRMCDGIFNESNRVLADQLKTHKLSEFLGNDKKEEVKK
jgi:hypothetical protein